MSARAAAVTAIALLAAGCAAGSGGVAEAPVAATAPAGAAVRAAADTRSEPFTLVPDGAPALLAMRLAPGGTRVLRLRVANGADRPRSFALRASSPWVVLPPGVAVPPRQSARVAAVVTVPRDAAAGRHVVRVGALAAGPADAALAISYESALRLRLTVGAP